MSQSPIGSVLEQLQRQKFYGSLEMKFEGGRVVLLRKTERIKPVPYDYRNNRGDSNGETNEE